MRRNIILLNGPSSAGKSTLSGELQKRIKAHGEEAVIISIDDYMITDPKETIYEDDVPLASFITGNVFSIKNDHLTFEYKYERKEKKDRLIAFVGDLADPA